MGLRNATPFANFPDEMTELGKFIFIGRIQVSPSGEGNMERGLFTGNKLQHRSSGNERREKLKLFDNMFHLRQF